jgi:hypothetical protein
MGTSPKIKDPCQNPKFTPIQTYEPKPLVFASGRGQRIIAETCNSAPKARIDDITGFWSP